MKIDGNKLKSAMTAKGKTTKDLAAVTGRGIRRIQQLVKGGGVMYLNDARAVAKCLGVTLDEIGKGEK